MRLNLLWDFDGTLFDTYPAIVEAFVAAMADRGYTAEPALVASLARVSLNVCIVQLASDSGLAEHHIADAFRQHYRRIPMEQQRPFAGTRDVCEAITNSGGLNVIVTHRDGRSVGAFLQQHRFEHLVGGCISADDQLPRKPDPAMFLAAIRRFRLDPSHSMAIGDRLLDIESAQSAGLRAAAFRCHDETGADFRFTEFNELAAWLKPTLDR